MSRGKTEEHGYSSRLCSSAGERVLARIKTRGWDALRERQSRVNMPRRYLLILHSELHKRPMALETPFTVVRHHQGIFLLLVSPSPASPHTSRASASPPPPSSLYSSHAHVHSVMPKVNIGRSSHHPPPAPHRYFLSSTHNPLMSHFPCKRRCAEYRASIPWTHASRISPIRQLVSSHILASPGES